MKYMRHLYLVCITILFGACSQRISHNRLLLFLNESNNTIIQEYCDSLIDLDYAEEPNMFLLIAQKWTPIDTILTICTTKNPIILNHDGPGNPLQYALYYREHILLIVFLNIDSLPNVFCEMRHNRRLEAELVRKSYCYRTRGAPIRENIRYFKINNGKLERMITLSTKDNDSNEKFFDDFSEDLFIEE